MNQDEKDAVTLFLCVLMLLFGLWAHYRYEAWRADLAADAVMRRNDAH